MGLTDFLDKAAQASATGRAAAKGPAAYARRQVRRRVYRAGGRATRRFLRRSGF